MAIALRPKPVVDHDSEPFWAAVQNNKFMLKKCGACGSTMFYPRVVCPQCMSEDLSWYEASGCATIYTYTVSHRAVQPYWETHVPYVIALIDLIEGARFLAYVVDPPDRVRIGAPVKVHYTEVEGFKYPDFQLVD